MQKSKWKRILYEDQGVPDNYVDESFLKGRKTVVKIYELKTLIFSSFVLLQHLCVVCLFVLTWLHMSEGVLSPTSVLFVCLPLSALLCLVFAISSYTQKTMTLSTIVEGTKTVFLLLVYTALASPILKTLTHTISTDTVYAMTTLMLLGHLVFHDYGSTGVLVSQSVSLNMAVFAAVCLASRLETTEHTFATIVLALQLFGLWPIFRRRIAVRSQKILPVVTLLLFAVVLAIFTRRSLWSGVGFACVGISISILFPFVLVSLQHQKDNIYGPWDEAVLSD